jgi:hypothetical protein
MAYNTLAFNEFVDNVERTVLEQIQTMKPNMVRSLFRPVPWNPGDGEKVTFNSVALSGFAPRVIENENYQVVNPTKGNELSKTQLQFGDKLEITRRMWKFNDRYANAQFDAQALVRRLTNSLDLEMTMQCFAEADQTTFTPLNQSASYNIASSDAQALVSTSHSYGGVTFSNMLNNATQAGGAAPALSIGALTTAISTMTQNTPDDFGTFIAPQPDTILIANEQNMIVKCHQMFGSSLTPETNNNAVNFYGGTGQFKVVALNFGDRKPNGTVDTNAATTNMYRWGVLDSNMCSRAWQFMMAEEPTPEQKFTDSDNVLAKILVTQFAAYAIVQPQGSLFSLSVTKPTLS